MLRYRLVIFLIPVAIAALMFAGCSRRELTGVVQSSRMVQGGYQLLLGTTDSSDYIFVDGRVLLDLQGLLTVWRNSTALILWVINMLVGESVYRETFSETKLVGDSFMLRREDRLSYFEPPNTAGANSRRTSTVRTIDGR